MIIYEKIMVFKRMHYIVYWLLVSTILFLCWEFLGRYVGENKYFLFRLLMSYGGLGELVIIFTSIAHTFRNTLVKLEEILVIPTTDHNEWVDKKMREVFGFETFLSKLFPPLFAISVTLSVLIWFLPYQSKLLNIFWVAAMQPFLLISGHGAYCILSVLVFLSQISSYPVKVPFYRRNHPSIESVSFFYSYATCGALISYLWLLLETRLGPYGFTSQPIVVTWLLIIGFFPLSMFIWSFIKVNALTRRIKQSHIDVINKEVKVALDNLKKKTSKENAEALNQIMDIQYRVERENVVFIKIEHILTFASTLIAPFGQWIITFLKRWFP